MSIWYPLSLHLRAGLEVLKTLAETGESFFSQRLLTTATLDPSPLHLMKFHQAHCAK